MKIFGNFMKFTLIILSVFTLFFSATAADYQMVRVDIQSRQDLEKIAGLGIDFETQGSKNKDRVNGWVEKLKLEFK